MIIPDSIKEAYLKEANDRFSKDYKDLTGKDDFDSYLQSFAVEMIESVADEEEIDVYKHTHSCRKMKAYVLNKFIEKSFDINENDFVPEGKLSKLDLACERVKAQNTISLKKTAPSKLQFMHHAYKGQSGDSGLAPTYKSFEEYIRFCINQYQSWAYDNSQYLLEFPYMKDMYSKAKAKEIITRDLTTLFYIKISDVQGSTIDMSMLFYPKEYLDIPIDPFNRKSLTEISGDSYIHVHQLDEFRSFTTHIAARSEDNKISSYKMLSLSDIDVIIGLIKLSDEHFLKTRTVLCKFRDLVTTVYTSIGSFEYKQIANSLEKLSSYLGVYHDTRTNETINYDILKADLIPVDKEDEGYVDISTKKGRRNKYDRLAIRAVFSDRFITSLVENAAVINSIHEDKDTIDNLTRALITHLQNTRYACSSDGSYDVRLGYTSYFNTKLVLGFANKSRNLKLIEQSLTKIMDLNIIIKSFRRQKDYFYITFYPVSPSEKESLMRYIESISKVSTIAFPALPL